jgi:hypothetical protein
MAVLDFFKDFEIRKTSETRIPKYVELLKGCFPTFNASQEYLEWLYFKNPLGEVLGFDAIYRDEVVAHYACIPTKISGINGLALLSLNTATSPRFQGRGLFKVLAQNTYELAAESHYSCVVGVANGNSFNAFVRHLGFEHLGNLDLRFGFLARPKRGARIYSQDDLDWRCSSTRHEIKQRITRNQSVNFSTRIHLGIKLWALCPTELENSVERKPRKLGLTLDWRRTKKPWIFLPARFKPSPLALIYKSLDGTPASCLSSWSFPDFDAY